MGKPSPPPAPDYKGAAQAQGTANVDAARVQGRLNNPNVISPYGTQTVTYEGDTPTLRQTLSPEQQGLLDLGNSNQAKLGQVAGQGADALKGVVGTGVDFSGLPAAAGSADATRKKVIDAMMGRANEDYGKSTDQANSDLVAAGIRPGSKAYADKMQMIERSHNDARNLAEISGGNAAAQDFNIDNQRRQQAITEMLAQRQVPLNEITALMSGSQVTSPFSTPGYSASANVAPAPTYQATSDTGNFMSDLYNLKAQQYGNNMNGLFKLGSAAIMAGA